jgi:transglutaminase-like putative cysteine protease
MATWDDFGKWVAVLNHGRDELPAKTKQEITALTSGMKTVEEKTKVLYEFLQNKTRYVGIQLGIGGYQPFEASVVDETGYGDCKALSNYMVSMLKAVGIKANYCLINAGSNEL